LRVPSLVEAQVLTDLPLPKTQLNDCMSRSPVVGWFCLELMILEYVITTAQINEPPCFTRKKRTHRRALLSPIFVACCKTL
jgi:hypothetical protein